MTILRLAVAGFALPWLLLSCSTSNTPAKGTPTQNNSETTTALSAPAKKQAPSDDAAQVVHQNSAPFAEDPCAAAIAFAARTIEIDGTAVEESFFKIAPSAEPFDFNQDGQRDCVLSGASRNFVFIGQPKQASSFQYVGEIIADTEFDRVRIHCSAVMKKGLCALSGSQRMIHGETQTRNYEFDGTQYQQVSVHLSEPHPKFGP